MIDCVCGWQDGDPAQVYKVAWRRARKVRTCCECGSSITVGEMYERVDGLWDGRWDHYDTCRSCIGIWRDFFCGERMFGGLSEMLWESFNMHLTHVPEDEDDDN